MRLDILILDIGANHPTSISNTYLLYRRGFSGYLIEPNHELSSLNRMFRARDHAVQMGIAPLAAIQKLQVSTTPTISSFSESHFIKRNQTRCRVEPVPTMPLDEAFRSIPGSIGLLNIDVEGMNWDVLVSGLDVLRRSHYACIEHDDDAEAKRIRDILCRANFNHIETLSCNQIFENRKFHRP